MKAIPNAGQALVEYILIFGVISLIAVGLVKGFNNIMNEMSGSLGYSLSSQLSSGTCEQLCFFDGYKN